MLSNWIIFEIIEKFQQWMKTCSFKIQNFFFSVSVISTKIFWYVCTSSSIDKIHNNLKIVYTPLLYCLPKCWNALCVCQLCKQDWDVKLSADCDWLHEHCLRTRPIFRFSYHIQYNQLVLPHNNWREIHQIKTAAIKFRFFFFTSSFEYIMLKMNFCRWCCCCFST